MTQPQYEYHGLLASTWDLWRDDTSNWDDRFFFLDIIHRYGQPALDIGCGTGRIVLDYLAEGIDIDGVDNSPEMLAICRGRAAKMGLSPNLYQQRMEALELPRRYRTIVVPSSTWQLLTDPDVARAALERFFAHLQPGGALVMPVSCWREGDPVESGWTLLFEKVRPEDGAMVRSWTHEWEEPDKQLWHVEQRFVVELNGDVIAREEHRHSPEGRWYTQAQAVQLFWEVGFTDIQLLRAFERRPAAEDDHLYCVLGVRPLAGLGIGRPMS